MTMMQTCMEFGDNIFTIKITFIHAMKTTQRDMEFRDNIFSLRVAFFHAMKRTHMEFRDDIFSIRIAFFLTNCSDDLENCINSQEKSLVRTACEKYAMLQHRK